MDESNDLAGIVCCDAVAANCVCVLAVDHAGPHQCEAACGGSWLGDIDGDYFEIVSLPVGRTVIS